MGSTQHLALPPHYNPDTPHASSNMAYKHRIWLPNESGVHEVRIQLGGVLNELHVTLYEKLSVGLNGHIAFPPRWYTFGRAMLPFIRVGAEGYQYVFFPLSNLSPPPPPKALSVCVRVYISLSFIPAHTHTPSLCLLCVCARVRVCVYEFVNMCVCMCVREYACACVHACMRACVCACVCACVHPCIRLCLCLWLCL